MLSEQSNLSLRLSSTKKDNVGNIQYWLDRMEEAGYGHPRVSATFTAAGSAECRLENALCRRLLNMTDGKEAAIQLLVLTFYSVLVSKYTGEHRFIVGTYDFGKPDDRRILPVAMDISPDSSLRQLLPAIRQQYSDALRHSVFPLELLVDRIAPGAGRTFFSALYGVDVPESLAARLSMSSNPPVLHARLANGRILLSVDHAGFWGISAVTLLDHLVLIADRMSAHPELLYRNVELLTNDQCLQIDSWSKGASGFPGDDPFAGTDASGAHLRNAWGRQVAATPNAIALEGLNVVLSYAELDRWSDQISAYLEGMYRVREGQVVAILCERSELQIALLLAVLKVDAIFLTIDTKWPRQRILEVLVDSDAALLVSYTRIKFDGFTGDHWMISSPIPDLPPAGAPAAVARGINETAYMIYTSGSTGRPKGIAVKHVSIFNTIVSQIKDLGITTDDKILQFASASFDAFHLETLLALLAGACLVQLMNEIIEDTAMLENFLLDKRISFLFLPPIYLSQLDKKKVAAVRTVAVGGDFPIASDLVELAAAGVRCYNFYGPSETAIMVTKYRVLEHEMLPLPIGQPISNTSAYILDRHLNRVAPGLSGELHIGGVAAGGAYHKLPDQTASKFIPNPYGEGLLFRTGDLACWRDDGNIILLGRVDEQVKIRGQRVELQEIHQRLSALKGIRESAVLLDTDVKSEPHIRAFYTGEEAIMPAELASALGENLPSYMIPASFLRVNKIPLNHAGKTDRDVLLELWRSYRDHPPLKAPVVMNAVQKVIFETWTEVLGKAIGLGDNLLSEGGDSIKVIQFCSRLAAKGYWVTARQVFEHPTISGLSAVLTAVDDQAIGELEEGLVPLSPIQCLFFEMSPDEPWHFNQSAILKLNVATTTSTLQQVFSRLLQHHDALRIRFLKKEYGYVQENLAFPVPVVINEYTFREDPITAIRNTAAANQGKLVLSIAPLMWLDVYRTVKGDYLGIFVNHLVIDAVSWGILLEDLDHLLKQTPEGLDALPARTTSWKVWCENLQSDTPRMTSFKEAGRFPPLIEGRKSVAGNVSQMGFTLDPSMTSRLDKGIHHRYRTNAQDFLLAALAASIFMEEPIDMVTIDVETHGRRMFNNLDVSRTIGWFTSLFPFQLRRQDVADPEMLIITTKEEVRDMQRQSLDYMKHISGGGKAKRCGILFNYMSTVANRRFDSFEWSGIPPGAVQSPMMERFYEWEVNALITDGKLQVALTFCPDNDDREKMNGLMVRMQEKLIQFIEIFSCLHAPLLTPSDLLAGKIDLGELLELQQGRDIQNMYPLTPMQEGLYYHFLKDTTAGYYSTQLGYRLIGRLKVDLLKHAFEELLSRHPGVRSIFIQDKKGHPWQLECDGRPADFAVQDLSLYSAGEAEKRIASFKEEDRKSGFDLVVDSPMRIRIFVVSEREFYFIWSYHHIIMDGWSMGILLDEWTRIYQAAIEGVDHCLPLPPSYSHYISWLTRKDPSASYAYWQGILKGYPGGPHLPRTGLRPGSIDAAARSACRLTFDEARSEGIRRQATRMGVTLNVLFQGIWSVILGRYGNSGDVVFGTVVSGRPAELPAVESIAGLFINTIPVRAQFRKDQLFSALLTGLQVQGIDSGSHQYCSLAEIGSRVSGAGQLVDHILLFENYPVGAAPQQKNGLFAGKDSFSIIDSEAFDTNNYDLTVVVQPEQAIRLSILFNPQVYAGHMAGHFLQYIEALIDRLIEEGDQAIGRLGRLPHSLELELLARGREEAIAVEGPLTITGQIERTVLKYGSNLALVGQDGSYTYEELASRSEGLAAILRKMGEGGKGKIVALHLDRTAIAFIAIAGILRSGAAYVPIDPAWPFQRKQDILQDAGVTCIVANSGHLSQLVQLKCRVIAMDILDYADPASGMEDAPAIDPEDRAYLIYTSGSTGRPKGAGVAHRANVNMARAQISRLGITDKDHILQFAPLIFDASIYEWSIAFYSGATLYIPEDRVNKSPDLFTAFLKANKITTMILPPPFFNLLTLDASSCPRVIVQGGSSPDPARTKAVAKFAECYNAYGPTECAVCIAIRKVEDEDYRLSALPIGRPVAGNSILLLDKDMELVPPGAEGEICVSGNNLGMGYTSGDGGGDAAFTAHPYESGSTLYRTGDLGRWLPGYLLQFIGRKDRQLKIRGYRIEPVEVEAAMGQLPHIEQCVVATEEDDSGLTLLVAWLVAGPGYEETAIRQQLRESLPAYMIPDRFVQIDVIPTTSNGKIDYHALTAAVTSISRGSSVPVSNVERQLFTMWESVLGISDFGIHHEYFEIGGNSLSLIRVHALIRQCYPEVSVADLFNYGTIAEMAAYIVAIRNKDMPAVEAGISLGSFERRQYPVGTQWQSLGCDLASTEWEQVAKAFGHPSQDRSDEEMLMGLYCFALSEATCSQEVRVVVLDDSASYYKGLVAVDFSRFDTREGLLSHLSAVNSHKHDRAGMLSLDVTRFSRSDGELVAGYCFGADPGDASIPCKDMDILLKGRRSANGDCKIMLIWNAAALDDGFPHALFTVLTNITGNLL